MKEYWFLNDLIFDYVGEGRVDEDLFVYENDKKTSKFTDLVNLSEGMCDDNLYRLVSFLNMKRAEYRPFEDYSLLEGSFIKIDSYIYAVEKLEEEMYENGIPPVRPKLTEEQSSLFVELNGNEPIVSFNDQTESFWLYTDNTNNKVHVSEVMDDVVDFNLFTTICEYIERIDGNYTSYGAIANVMNNGGIPPYEYVESEMNHDEKNVTDEIKDWIRENNITGKLDTILDHGSYFHTPIDYINHVLESKGINRGVAVVKPIPDNLLELEVMETEVAIELLKREIIECEDYLDFLEGEDYDLL